jgi:hypothetical protein
VKLRGRVIVIAAAAAVAATFVGPATGRVVIQQGIAGIKLQDSRDHVRDVLGKPRGVKYGRNLVGRYVEYRYPGLLVRFQGLKSVTMISTTRTSERTGKGIGVGSPKAQVKRIQGMHCRVAFGSSYCYVGALRKGRRSTLFFLNDQGRVDRVAVGFVGG